MPTGRPLEITRTELSPADLRRSAARSWDADAARRRVDLRRVISERWGVAFHERSVGKLRHRLGFARLSVRPKPPKSDLAAQAEWGKKLRHAGA